MKFLIYSKKGDKVLFRYYDYWLGDCLIPLREISMDKLKDKKYIILDLKIIALDAFLKPGKYKVLFVEGLEIEETVYETVNFDKCYFLKELDKIWIKWWIL